VGDCGGADTSADPEESGDEPPLVADEAAVGEFELSAEHPVKPAQATAMSTAEIERAFMVIPSV